MSHLGTVKLVAREMFDQIYNDNKKLKEQLRVAVEALELIAGPVEFYCEVGEHSKQSAAKACLQKLKGGA